MEPGSEAWNETLARFYGAPEPSTWQDVLDILLGDEVLSEMFLGAVGVAGAVPLGLLHRMLSLLPEGVLPDAAVPPLLLGTAAFGGVALALLPWLTTG